MAARHLRLGAKICLRAGLPLVILTVCLWVLSRQVSGQIWQDIPDVFARMPVGAWLAAAGLTAISLYSVGRYDGVAHRYLQTRIPQQAAERSGVAAIALAQILGFGVFTGALARWRILSDLTLRDAFALSAFVSVSFVAGWAVVTAVLCLVLPAPGWTTWPALAVLAAGGGTFALLALRPNLHLGRHVLSLPSLRLTGAILVWTCIDTVAAAGALWMLLPADAGLSFLAFLPLFLIALGTALISNTPGGVGPFELVLMGALPHVAANDLLISIVAYRLIYYALPACLAFFALMRPGRVCRLPVPTRLPMAEVFRAPRSEVGVIAQNGGAVVDLGSGAAALWRTGQSLTLLFAPLRGGFGDLLVRFRQIARADGRWPLAYKIDARAAVAARRAGWSVLHLADDAILDLDRFTLDRPACRTLRRKLRQAQKAGVTITCLPADPSRWPWADLARIDAEWCARHGPARGGTMGRYTPDYVSGQWVAVASVDGQPVAFVTFFASQQEWALDLMRQTDDAPDGVMHALVHRAIEAAQAQSVPRLSLAATPACPDPQSALWRALAMRVVAAAGGPGLRQFKSAFGPQWEPRYAAAQTPLRMAITLADIAREVHAPPPLPHQDMKAAHQSDENYELVSRKRA